MVIVPAALGGTQVDFPGTRPQSGDVAIRWRDLAERAELVIFRSDTRREADGTVVHEAGSANDPAALRREIGGGLFRRRAGEWKLPAAFLESTPERRLSALGAEFRVVHEAPAARTFAKGSTLRAERRMTLRMECGE